MSYTEHIAAPQGHPVSCGVRLEEGCEHILLVEDERLVRDVAAEVLTVAGYVVWKADSAAEATKIFKKYSASIGLLITDLVLPDDRGLALARKLQAVGGSFRTILISGYPERVILRNSLDVPEFSYLPKPFSSEALTRRVRHVLTLEKQRKARMNPA